MRTKNYSETGFTLSENDRAILKEEVIKTGKSRSEVLRGLIAELGKRQQSQNQKEAI